MYKVFISYSRSTEDFSRKLAKELSNIGYDIWLDVEDIPGGMKWSSAIQQGLDTADVMLVVVSPGAMSSLNVEDEWQYFMDKQKPVIPVLYEPADVHFQLNRLQYIDFHSQSFSDAFTKLLKEIEGKIKDPGSAFVTPEGRKAYPPAFSGKTYPKWMRYVQYAWWGVITIFVIVAVIFYTFIYNPGGITNNGNNVTFDTALSLPAITEVTAYTSPTTTSDSGTILNPVFEQRIFVRDTVWYKIDNPDSITSLYVLDSDIPENASQDSLMILPAIVNQLLGGSAELYDAPGADAPALSLLGSNNSSAIHGYSVDELGGVWYYIYHAGQRDFYWIPAEDESYTENLVIFHKSDSAIDVYNRPVADEALSQEREFRIVGQVDGWYRIILNHNGEWTAAYVEADTLNLAPLIQDRISEIPR